MISDVEMAHRGDARNFPTEGLELPTGGGAKMNEKWCFPAIFCQISPDENPEFPLTGGGGLDASDGGGCSPLVLSWRHP